MLSLSCCVVTRENENYDVSQIACCKLSINLQHEDEVMLYHFNQDKNTVDDFQS